MTSIARTRTRILVVEDDPTVAEIVTRYLEREGFSVEHRRDGREALRYAVSALPDLVVLDLMLPGLDGLEVCRRLRSVAPVPVLMLTARSGEEHLVAGLELGADDYMAKPFSPRELTARVKAVLRRSRDPLGGAPPAGEIVAGELVVDLAAREVRRSGELVALTAREFDLLAFLARNPRHAFSRDDLLERVWGYSYGDTSTVTVHIRRLREKLEADPSTPAQLLTVWGVGYRFDP
jgi:DNA-binding response OmpR family regulator